MRKRSKQNRLQNEKAKRKNERRHRQDILFVNSVQFSKMIIYNSFSCFLLVLQQMNLIQCHLFGESSRVEVEHDIAKDQAAEFHQIVEDTE